MKSGSYRALLAQPDFRALWLAQFTGALNDNLLRMVASLFALTVAGSSGSGYVALAGLVFILPFLTLPGWAGALSDTFGKRSILIGAKLAELLIMGLAAVALMVRSIEALLVVLFLMAVQSTFFSPARYGILPDLIDRRDLSRANGLGEMSMYWAILIGTGLGGALFEIWRDALYVAAAPMVAISIVGVVACKRVGSGVPATSADRRSSSGMRRRAFAEGLRTLRSTPALGIAVFGISLLWGLGAMLQMNLLFYGKHLLELGETKVGLLQATLGLGIGAGSLLAGWLSGDRVRPALARVGLAGMACSLLAVGLAPPSASIAFFAVCAVGLAGGLFIVPVISVLHQYAPVGRGGTLFATNNFFNMIGVLIGIGVFYGLRDVLGFDSADVLVGIGVVALAAAIASRCRYCVAVSDDIRPVATAITEQQGMTDLDPSPSDSIAEIPRLRR